MSTLWLQARKRKQTHRTNILTYTLNLGFFAGVFWSVLHWMFYVINFTEAVPGYMLEPFFTRAFLRSGWGQAAGLAAFIAFSIMAAYLYIGTLKRFRGPWAGLAYGVGWWALIFLVIGPLAGMVLPPNRIGWDTLITEFCVYLMWGMFIGYSIAFEFHDEASREPTANRA